MSNIIKAIINISNNPIVELKNAYLGKNKINNVGDALERYVQDAFANTLNKDNLEEKDREKIISEIFSYKGNSRNPPDIILKNGDAIEVKKIEKKNSSIALNSSYPKHKLYSTDSRITNACRNCEEWTTKDIIYVVGTITDKKLRSLWFIYGDCYAASAESYTSIYRKIKESIHSLKEVEFTKTNELGKINKIDPLGITNLRIRGMWHIENPSSVFNMYVPSEDVSGFNLTCIMRKSKFESHNNNDIKNLMNCKNVSICDIEIKDPDNTANLLEAKLITVRGDQ